MTLLLSLPQYECELSRVIGGPTCITWRQINTGELITIAEFRYRLVQDVRVPDVDSCSEFFTPITHVFDGATFVPKYVGTEHSIIGN